MPKDEFDFDDPMELNGVGIVSTEDTTEAMTECFVEEFMRLGHNHKQILAMFRNPHYIGMNMALEKRGEQFVRDIIAEVFTRWGRPVVWNSGFGRSGPPGGGTPSDHRGETQVDEQVPAPSALEQSVELNSAATDPMGVPVPKLNL